MAKDYSKINSDLAKEFFRRYPRYREWSFDFEYPGYLVYQHGTSPIGIYFTPGWNLENYVSIQVNENEEPVDGGETLFVSDQAEDLFGIVKQWLDYAEFGAQAGPFEWHSQGVKWTPRKK